MTREEKLKEMTKHVNHTLREFGPARAAREFMALYEHYRELALVATDGQYEDMWTHEQLMEFLKTGEF